MLSIYAAAFTAGGLVAGLTEVLLSPHALVLIVIVLIVALPVGIFLAYVDTHPDQFR